MELCMRRLTMSIAVVALVACEEEPLVVVPAQIPPEEVAAAKEAAAAAAAPALGKIQAMAGAVTVSRGSLTPEVAVDADVKVGDRIETGDDGRVRLQVEADGTLLAIGSNATLVLTAFDAGDAGRTGKVEIATGKFWAQMGEWSHGGTSLEFETPSALAVVRGTTLLGDVEKELICAVDGEVEVTSKKAKRKKPLNLKKGQCASKLSKAKPKKTKVRPKQLKKLLADIEIAAE